MNNNKLPRAKLRSSIGFCKAVAEILASTAREDKPDGADDFFPMVNYTLLLLDEETSLTLFSNLEYIRLFRHSSRLEG